MTGIYKITSPSGKIYIGQSWKLEKRQKDYKHYKGYGQPYLNSSILKYGWNSHKFEVIHELPEDIEQKVLDRYEILYWELYKNCGYLMLNVKEPGFNGKHSKETILKISNSKKGQDYWTGRKHTLESRIKQSESAKNKKISLEIEILRRSRISNNSKKKKSLEHSKNISISKMGNKNPVFGMKWKLIDGKRKYFKN